MLSKSASVFTKKTDDNTCSVGVCARAQRKSYMDTKENDHLNFYPCISSTKK